jgi:hypothetical protein
MEFKKQGNMYVAEVNKELTTEEFYQLFTEAIRLFLHGEKDAKRKT